jgi:uncharacterized DUF497 family protein
MPFAFSMEKSWSGSTEAAYEEERWAAIGLAEDKEAFVVYVEKGEDTRPIISARRATRREREIYWREIRR